MGRAVSTALLGLALLGVGVGFGASALVLPGGALVVLTLIGGGWAGLAGRGRLERRIGAASVVEEEPCPITLQARLLLPCPPGSEIVEPLARAPGRPVRWGRNHRLETEARFPRRGRHVLEPGRFVARDPLGVASREIRSPAGQEVLVLPRVEAVHPTRAGVDYLSARRQSAEGPEEGPRVDFDTLREARPETPVTRIHWPAVARTGTLVELSLLAQIDRRPLVMLDASSPSSIDALDRAVRAAASLCVSLARGGGCDLLLPGERRPSYVDATLASWPTMHAHLALVEAGGHAVVPTRLGRTGAIFLVSAQGPEENEAAIPRRLTRGVACFQVTPGPATAYSAFTVAGCHGRRLGRTSRRAA